MNLMELETLKLDWKEAAACPVCLSAGRVRCEQCHGLKTRACDRCQGTGKRRRFWWRVACSECEGRGSAPCWSCRADGTVVCPSCGGQAAS